MTLREFGAVLRGWMRANGVTPDATGDEMREFMDVLAEEDGKSYASLV